MRAKRTIFVSVVILLLAASVCIILVHRHNTRMQSTRSIREAVAFNGASVDVACEGVGSPTVLFEPGLNESYYTFASIQEEISKLTRTFSYDRLAMAYGKNEKKPRSSLGEVQDLHKLLDTLHVKPPYIIVAHSIAGYNARLFATCYPNEVSGIVFIDCSHENQSFQNVSTDPSYTELTPGELYTSQEQVRASRKKDLLRNLPITVITAGYQGSSEYAFMKSYWTPLQNDLASLSDKSRHITVQNSGHLIQTEHPDIVIKEIKSMLKRVQ